MLIEIATVYQTVAGEAGVKRDSEGERGGWELSDQYDLLAPHALHHTLRAHLRLPYHSPFSACYSTYSESLVHYILHM